MLIDNKTQISQLRYMGIMDNLVFSILRAKSFQTVEDILTNQEIESLGIKDYVVKSLRSFLGEMVMYEQPIEKVREEIAMHRNPQMDDAVDEALSSDEMKAAREEGTLLFTDVVDFVSFLLIDNDDEYYKWLEQKGIDDQKEMSAQVTTYKMMLKVKEYLTSVNRYNLYIRVIDHVLKLDRFRGVASQMRNNRGGNFRNNNFRNDRNNNSFRDQRNNNFRNDRNNNFRDQHNNKFGNRNDFRGGNQDFRSGNQDFRGSNQDFRSGNQDFRGSNQDFRSGNQDFRSRSESRAQNPDFRSQIPDFSDSSFGQAGGLDALFGNGNSRGGFEKPVEQRPMAERLTPFRMIDDIEVQKAAKEFFIANGYYPMFRLLVSFLNSAKVMGTVRLGGILSAVEGKDKDDWSKMETRRRYVEGVNRGLGLPADQDLQDLIDSPQWAMYGFDKQKYFSAKNYPWEELCKKEEVDLSFNMFAFIVSIVKKMSLVNIQVGKPSDDDTEDLSNIYTYVVPADYMNFSYSSFVIVSGNRKKEFEGDRTAYMAFLKSPLSSNRFWRGDYLTQDAETFVEILRDINVDIFGLYADDTTLVEEMRILDVDYREKPRLRPRLKKLEPEEKEKLAKEKPTKEKVKHPRGKVTIIDAIVQVVAKSGPMLPGEVVKGVLEINPNAKESSIKVIMTTARNNGLIEYTPEGMLRIVEK